MAWFASDTTGTVMKVSLVSANPDSTAVIPKVISPLVATGQPARGADLTPVFIGGALLVLLTAAGAR